MKFVVVLICSIVLSVMIFQGCKSNNSYDNKAKYEIRVNEKFEIYYSTNSCCYYCISNKKELEHIELLDHKLIVPEKEGCDGCSYTSAFIFRGVSRGIDTLELKNASASMNCDSNNVALEKYIIEIK